MRTRLQERYILSKSNSRPLVIKPRQASPAGEELLHGGLLEVALLGDQAVQAVEQRIHVAEGFCDCLLLVFIYWPWELQILEPLAAQVGDGRSLECDLGEHARPLAIAEQV